MFGCVCGHVCVMESGFESMRGYVNAAIDLLACGSVRRISTNISLIEYMAVHMSVYTTIYVSACVRVYVHTRLQTYRCTVQLTRQVYATCLHM